MFSIETQREGSEFSLKLIGSLDTNTAPDLETIVNNDIEDVETLVFDLGELEYVSSAGLRILLTAQKKMLKQGEMIIRHVPEKVMDILEVTGFSEILNIEE